jgi:Domain of unknown function (DUF397)
MPPMDAVVVDVGWRKASRSVNNGQCVEVSATHADVKVRDSVDPSGPVVSYPARTWQAFLTSAKTGTFDATY